MITEPKARDIKESRQKAVIIYRSSLMRDVLTHVLTDGGISVVASIPEGQDSASVIEETDANIIVFDDADADNFQAATQMILFGSKSIRTERVIGLGQGYLVSIVFRKEIIPDAGVGDLVARASPIVSYCEWDDLKQALET